MLLGICNTAAFAEDASTCITVPNGTELYVGLKGSTHFVSFTEIIPGDTVENEDTTAYYFELEDGKTYNYRITSEDYITYAGKFKNTAGFSLNITPDMLETDGKTKTTVDRDTASNNGYNVADIYLNINPQGFMTLNEGDTYQLVNLRSWEAVDSVTANYFLEPDYHYTVIDENGESSDVVTVDENGLITAASEGTAIVLVTYDALNIDFGSGKEFYGAIWPENTGVFVVSVGSGDSGIETGMTINEGKNSSTIKLSGDAVDAEHDCIYFIGETGTYTFTPETDGCAVSVANPAVDTALSYNGFAAVENNLDGSFTVPLKNGRNIVKIEKDGKAEYQVITAKSVSVTVNSGEVVRPGDALSIVFDTLYHPSNKLAGVYNMTAIPVYTNVSGYDGKLIGGLSAQYNFASNANAQKISNVLKEKNVWGIISYEKDTDLTVPEDYAYDTFTLSGGMLYASGWGDAYGNHRGITLTDGKAANLTAEARPGWLGRLPDIEIPIAAPSDELISVSLDTTDVKTDYYVGDSFDPANLTVTANYAEDKTQLATNYTISPEVLTADTEKVTVTYRGQTAEIPVSVTTPKITSIEITTPPAKTSYTEGNTFDPTGMVVTAVYENGTSKAITDYSYSPNRPLEESDTEITVTYTGEDGIEELSSATVPITVTEKSSGGGGSVSSTITVYFTLYGDEKHGEPTESTGTHTMTANNLEEWVSKTAVTVDKGSYVIDAVTKALSIEGIPYTNDDNYISSIRGLSEFDNGSLSGWMYKLNGNYPSLGVAEQTLHSGDKIVFHYTDDYTAERSTFTTVSGGGSLSGSSPVKTEDKTTKEDIDSIIADTAAYVYKTVPSPSVGSVGGEWGVLGLCRSGADIPSEYYERYYKTVEEYVKARGGVLHEKKYTEYSRVIIALTAIGKNPADIAGYNLITPLEDYEKTILQGINGPVWALIALDCGDYGTQEIREKYISRILECELSGGGWALSASETTADADITAMVLTALSNYTDRQDAVEAVERGIAKLSALQNENGGYTNYNSENSESNAQVLVALSSLGISYTDERFVKNGNTLLDNMLTFYTEGQGFSHTDGSNLMATEQCLYALAAVRRLEAGQSKMFDMSDGLKLSESVSAPAIAKTEIKFPGKSFADIQNHPSQKAVEALAERGIISGMTENDFCPDNTMTRAQFTSIVVRALGVPLTQNAGFADVKESDWFYEYVGTAFNCGIVSGISETEFNPNGTITREEAAAMTARAARLCGINTDMEHFVAKNILAEFVDYVNVSDWAFSSVAFCYNESIFDRSEIEITPKQAVTRAQIAVMLYNLLGKAELL